MNRMTPGIRQSALAIAALLAACPRFADAQVTSYIGPDNGLWTAPENWSAGVPMNGGGQTFQAVIPSGPLKVQLDGSVTIDSLLLGQSGELTFLGGSVLTIEGGVVLNAGAMVLPEAAGLQFNVDTILGSGGMIVLNGSASGLDSAATVRVISDNAITGQGHIGGGGLKFVNVGTVTATAGVLTLHAFAAASVSDSFVNQGTAAAEGGGTLSLTGAHFNNVGGILEARAGSVLNITSGTTVNGGVVRSVGGGMVMVGSGDGTPAVLSHVALAGIVQTGASDNLTLLGSISNAGTLTSMGGTLTVGAGTSSSAATIANMGVIHLGPASTLFVNQHVTISGGGTLTLDGNAFGSSVGPSSTPWRLTNESHIVGQGTIGQASGGILFSNSGTIAATGGMLSLIRGSLSMTGVRNVNSGILRADGGTLSLHLLAFNNIGGAVEALADSVITGGSIHGGIARTAGGTITSMGIYDATISGAFLNSSFSGLVTAPETLQLHGTVTLAYPGLSSRLLNAGLVELGSAGAPASIRMDGDLTLSGSGTLSLHGGVLPPRSSTNNRFTNESLIIGQGTLGYSQVNGTLFKNSGTITASGGVLTLAVAFALNNPRPTHYNSGILRADGGTLEILSGYGCDFDNTDGLIEALPGSVVSLRSMNISGGVIRALPGGTITGAAIISNARLEGLIANGSSPPIALGGLIENGSTLTLLASEIVFNGVSLLNNGELELGGVVNGRTTNILVQGDTTFDGNGTITLNSAMGNVPLPASNTAAYFTNNTLIEGQGHLGFTRSNSGVCYTRNNGTISATSGTLTFAMKGTAESSFAYQNMNRGVLRADGGTLTLAGSGLLDNTDGLIEARPGSVVIVGPLYIKGGVIRAADGGTITLANSSLTDVRLEGLVDASLGSGGNVHGSLFNGGTLVISRTLGLGSSDPNSPSVTVVNEGLIQVSSSGRLAFNTNVTFDGGGTLTLDNSTSLSHGWGYPLRFTNHNTILGRGTLSTSQMTFTNAGTISATTGVLTLTTSAAGPAMNSGHLSADGGTLVLFSSSSNRLENSGGLLVARDGSVLRVMGSVAGGALRTDGSGTLVLTSGTLTNASMGGNVSVNGYTLGGVITIDGPSTLTGAKLTVGVNASPITVLHNAGLLTISPVDSLVLRGDVVLSGGGTLVLPSILPFTTSLPGRLTSDNLIVASGTLGMGSTALTNGGTIITSGNLTIVAANTANGFVSMGRVSADGAILTFHNGLTAPAGVVEAKDGGVLNFSTGAFSIATPIRLDGGAAVFASAPSSATTVSGAGTLGIAPGATLTSGAVTVSTLSISGTHVLRPRGPGSPASQVTTLVLAQDPRGNFTATLDLTDNLLILQAEDAVGKQERLDQLAAALASGFAGGTWNGPGITSSTAADDAGNLGLGVFDNAIHGWTLIGGQTVNEHSLLVSVARPGDATLDGVLDAQDLGVVANNWQKAVLTWSRGDLDLDGIVSIVDLAIVANNWQQSTVYGIFPDSPAPSSQSATGNGQFPPASVPEPASLVILCLGTAFLARRHRVLNTWHPACRPL